MKNLKNILKTLLFVFLFSPCFLGVQAMDDFDLEIFQHDLKILGNLIKEFEDAVQLASYDFSDREISDSVLQNFLEIEDSKEGNILDKIERLNLSGNQLIKLTPKIVLLRNLKELDISKNPITKKLPIEELARLKKLKKLYFDHEEKKICAEYNNSINEEDEDRSGGTIIINKGNDDESGDTLIINEKKDINEVTNSNNNQGWIGWLMGYLGWGTESS